MHHSRGSDDFTRLSEVESGCVCGVSGWQCCRENRALSKVRFPHYERGAEDGFKEKNGAVARSKTVFFPFGVIMWFEFVVGSHSYY